MSIQLQHRRGTTTQHNTFTGATGEVTIDTTKTTAVVHDGATAGGVPLLRQDLNNLSSAVPVAKGGTGSATAAGARGNLLPSFTGQQGKILAVNTGETDIEYVNNTATTFTDTTAIVQGSADNTKKMRFEADGITTATTRVVTLQNADLTMAGTNVAQNFTAAQRSAATTDNDGSFDLTAANNFVCERSVAQGTGSGFTLTFTNIASASGQSGYIKLINGSNYTVSKHTNTKVGTTFLTTVSATGTYLLSYFCDGTDVWVTSSGALT